MITSRFISTDTDSSIKRVFFLSELFGMFPFVLKEEGFRPKKSSCFKSFLVFIFIMLVSFTWVFCSIKRDKFDLLVLRLASHVRVLSAAVIPAVNVINASCKINTVSKIALKLRKLDLYLTIYGFKKNNKFKNSIILFLFSVLYTISAISDAYFTNRNDSYFILDVSLNLTILFVFVVVGQIIGILSLVQSRVEFSNEILMKKVNRKIHLDQTIDYLESILDICKDINEAYALIFLFIYIVSFLRIVAYTYFVLTLNDPFMVKVFFSYTIVFFYIASVIAYHCHSLNEKIKWFNFNLEKRVQDNFKNLPSERNLKLRLYITLNREAKFTAHEYFDINLSLIGKMSGAAFTYLFILLQISPGGRA